MQAKGASFLRVLMSVDWGSTPLGPMSGWPASLTTIVNVIVSASTPMALLWGAEGRLIYNEGYARIAGSRHPGILGACARDAWPEAVEFNQQVIRTVFSGEAMCFANQEFTLERHGAPEQVWLTLDYSPVMNASGCVAGVLALVRETTETVRAERLLANQRERFEQMFQQAPTFMAMLSGRDHVIEFANPGYAKLVGHREVVGRTVASALPEAVEQGYVALLDQVFTSGQAYSASGLKYAVQATPGGPVNERFVDFVYQPITDGNGQVTGIFVEGVDVTNRVSAETESQLNRQRLDLTLDNAQVRRAALARLSEELRDLTDPASIEFAAARILGETLGASRVGYGTVDVDDETLHVERDWFANGTDSLVGSLLFRDYGSFIDSLKRDELVAIPDVFADPRTSGAGRALAARSARAFVNVPLVEHDRLVAVLYVNATQVRHWSAEDLAFIEEISQRTRIASERARGQMALRQSEARLRDANETLEAKVEARTQELMQVEEALRQAQKMEAVGQLTGGIAHDFNNLLAAISGSLELLESRMSTGRMSGVGRYIDAAQSAARRAASLTQRLLAFSRRQTLDPKPTDVNKLIFGMEDLIRRSVGPEVRVELVGSAGLWLSRVDASQLENSLLNLAINARDAMAPSGGRLTIETANKWLDDRAARERDLVPGQYVSLCVTDTGTGMSPEVIARAFDPFFTTKPLGAGTGLGLSMVYGFVRQSGGQIRVYSEPGKGTTMCLYLPRVVGEPHTEEFVDSPAAAHGDGETILVVDDEETIRMLILEVLAEQGYTGVEASDGAAALGIVQSDIRIDLLVTDVGLPGGINGRQLADAARVLHPHLKVLFVTGFAENAAVGNGHLDAGMEVMTKPFSMAALGVKIRDMIERK